MSTEEKVGTKILPSIIETAFKFTPVYWAIYGIGLIYSLIHGDFKKDRSIPYEDYRDRYQ